MPERISAASIPAQWSANDPAPGSGVRHYDLAYRLERGELISRFPATTQTEATFEGESGHTHTFYVHTTDRVSNTGDWAEGSAKVVAARKTTPLPARWLPRATTMWYTICTATILRSPQDRPGVDLLNNRRKRQRGSQPTQIVGQRCYSPRLGRFISPDTIVADPSDPQTWNRYAYARANALRYVDPTGHCAGLPGAAFGACKAIVMAAATVVNKANEYREDIFFPDQDTTFGERLEASTVVGGGAVVFAAAATELAAGTLTTAATMGTATKVGAVGTTIVTTAGADGDYTNEASAVTKAVENGLKAVRADAGRRFPSFGASKYHMGGAGKGFAWHHIVGKLRANIAKSGQQAIQNSNNLIRLPDRAGEIHRQITAFYNSQSTDHRIGDNESV